MKRRVILSVFSAMLFFVSSVFAGDNLAARKKIIDQEFSAGDEIVQITKDKNARAIMDFLRRSFYLGAPVFHKDGLAVKTLQVSGKKEFYLCVVPLLYSDRSISKEWKENYDNNLAAFFIPMPNKPTIVLKENSQLSKTWQGLILIHEGSHALAFAADVFKDIEDPLMKRAMDELYAYRLETSLIETLGGPAYQKLLQEEVARLERDYVKQKSMLLPDYARYHERLDKIFGKSSAHLEMGARGSVFWINAVFRLIDKNYQSEDEREDRKADFLRSSYKDGIME